MVKKKEDRIANLFTQQGYEAPYGINNFAEGEFNKVYKVTSLKKTYILRVFRMKDWPEKGKLNWLDKITAETGVYSPRLIEISKRNNFFKFGYAIYEFLEGVSGRSVVINRKETTMDMFFLELGKTLRKVHSHKLPYYGLFQKTRYFNWSL